MSAFLYFRLDQVLVNAEDNMRSQIITGSVQGINHFSRIYSPGSYVRVPLLGLIAGFKKRKRNETTRYLTLFCSLSVLFELCLKLIQT